jgi:uncharacterized protein involved in outer membrane biogenesis
MLGILGKILKYLIILCIIIAACFAIVILFVSPNNFKKEINELIQNSTGYAFEIKGQIQWSFRPEMTLHLQDVSLASPSGFTSPLIVIKETNLYIDPYSLFKDNLIINKMEVKGITATIERQPSGAKNIDPSQFVRQPPATRSILIKEIILSDASCIIHDAQNKQNWSLSNANISTKNLNLNPFTKLDPVTIKGDINNLDLKLTMNIDTVITSDITKQTLNFDPISLTWGDAKILGKTTIAQYINNPTITGDISVEALDISALMIILQPPTASTDADSNPDTNAVTKIQGTTTFSYASQTQFLDLSEFNLKFDDGELKGAFKFSLQAPHNITFDVSATNLNLQPLSLLLSAMLPNKKPLPELLLPVDWLKGIALEGKFSGAKVKLGTEFLIDQITVDLGIQNGMVQFNPITLSAYEGNHNCSVAIDLNKDLPVFRIIDQANNMQLDPWIKLFDFPNTITGSAEAKISLELTGNNIDSLRHTANGTLNVLIKNGSVFGIDLEKLLKYAGTSVNDVMAQSGTIKGSDLNNLIKAKATAWTSSQQNNSSSKFDSFELRSDLKDGISTSNLAIMSPAFDLKGNGGFNWVEKSLKYDMKIGTKNPVSSPIPEIASYIKLTQVSMAVSGNLAQLIFVPDLQSYISTAVKQGQDVLFKRAVSKMIDTTGPSVKTNKAADEIFADSLKGLSK